MPAIVSCALLVRLLLHGIWRLRSLECLEVWCRTLVWHWCRIHPLFALVVCAVQCTVSKNGYECEVVGRRRLHHNHQASAGSTLQWVSPDMHADLHAQHSAAWQ